MKFASAVSAFVGSRSVGDMVEMWTYSELGVQKTPPCELSRFGTSTICFTLKSRRSIIAIRPLARSLMYAQRPSYSPLVSLRAGWWVSPQVRFPPAAEVGLDLASVPLEMISFEWAAPVA
ncbi:MAG: hypothetical protein IPO34_12735 [Dehalococcoidia bacterium]|nr:hypothetical protein [Dehalococcoidia bacterium]